MTEPRYSQACIDGKHQYCGGWLIGAVLCACFCHKPKEEA